MKKTSRMIVFSVIGLLVLSNPSESQFQHRLANDYGNIHGGMTLGFNELRAMGSSQYQSYVFFSKYHYAFGDLTVHYFGIGFMTFYVGSTQHDHIDSQENEIIS